MAVLTIKEVKPGTSKVGIVIFEEDPKRTIKYWKSAAFAESLKAGEKAEAAFETVKSQKEGYADEKFLKSWGGVSGGAKRGFGGGGFRGKSTEEINSIAAQVCVKDATALAIHNATHADDKPRAIDPNEIRSLALELANSYNLVYGIVQKAVKGEQA